MRRFNRWCLIGGVLAVVILFGEVSAQGVFLKDKQSGYYFTGGLYTGDDISARGFDIGIAARGMVDFGIAATNTTITKTHYYYPAIPGDPIGSQTSKSKTWNTGFYLREYVFRNEEPRGSRVFISLHQAMTWVSESLIPSDDPLQVIQFGGGVTFSVPAGEVLRLYIGGYYTRVMPSRGADDYNAFSIDAALQIPFTNSSLNIGPSVTFEEDHKTIGINIGVTAIGGDNRN